MDDIAPNLAIAARHIELLTGSADTYCHFRALHGKGGGWNLSGSLPQLWPDIEERQRAGWQWFVVVNEGGETAIQIRRVRALFVDADGVPNPSTWHAQPDFVVRRDATHWHAYWLVADMPRAGAILSKREFKTAQQRLAAYYRTDRKVVDLPRIMRLAGTFHLKDPANPVLVTIEGDANARTPGCARSTVELLSGLPEPAAIRNAASAMPTGEPVSLEILRDMLAYLDPGCDRDDWRNVIAAIHAAPVPDDDDESGRRRLAQEWSAGEYAAVRPANYSGSDDVDRVFDDMLPGGGIGVGTLIVKAREAGYEGATRYIGPASELLTARAIEPMPTLPPVPLSPDFLTRVQEIKRQSAPSPDFLARAEAIRTRSGL